MPIYPTLTKCMQCGTSEITEFFDQKQGRIFICWHCSHRVAAESPQSVRCIHCKSIRATEGVLASASGDGALEITIVNEVFRHSQTVTAWVQDLLIVANDEEADGTSSPRNDEPKSEQPRKGIFELSRRSSAGSSVERDRS
jgi:hypothetical protein